MNQFEYLEFIELAAGSQSRRDRELQSVTEQIAPAKVGERVYPHHHRRGIVLAAGAQRGIHQRFGGQLRIAIQIHDLVQPRLFDRFPDAIAANQENIAGFEFPIGIVESKMLIEPDRALEHVLHVGTIPDMVVGELRAVALPHAIDAGVADMGKMESRAAQDQCRERGRHAGELTVRRRLRQQPAIHRGEHAVQRQRYLPGVGRRVVVAQQAAHRVFRRFASAACTGYPVRHRQQCALCRKHRAFRRDGAEEILVRFAPPRTAGMADAHLQRTALRLRPRGRRGERRNEM